MIHGVALESGCPASAAPAAASGEQAKSEQATAQGRDETHAKGSVPRTVSSSTSASARRGRHNIPPCNQATQSRPLARSPARHVHHPGPEYEQGRNPPPAGTATNGAAGFDEELARDTPVDLLAARAGTQAAPRHAAREPAGTWPTRSARSGGARQIVVRPARGTARRRARAATRFIAGERRWRAAQMAGRARRACGHPQRAGTKPRSRCRSSRTSSART